MRESEKKLKKFEESENFMERLLDELNYQGISKLDFARQVEIIHIASTLSSNQLTSFLDIARAFKNAVTPQEN